MSVLVSESWTGSNGSSWSSIWTTSTAGTGGTVDVQSNAGRLQGNSSGGIARALCDSTSQHTTGEVLFRTRADNVGNSGNWVQAMLRGSTTWGGGGDVLNDCYYCGVDGGANLFMGKLVSGSDSLLAITTVAFSANTWYWIRFRVSGSTITARWWADGDTEPSSWTLSATDSSLTSGRLAFGMHAGGGVEHLLDDLTLDSLTGTSQTVTVQTVAGVGGVNLVATTGGSNVRRMHSGYAWTASPPTTPAAYGPLAKVPFHSQLSVGGGAGNPNPSPGVYAWTQLDQAVQRMRDSGAKVKVLTLFSCPGWMKTDSTDPAVWASLENDLTKAPTAAHVADFAALCGLIAQRYPDVAYFSVWRELIGMWDAPNNTFDHLRYVTLYNAVYNAIKNVRPDARVGGPYVNLASATTPPEPTPRTPGLPALSGSWGTVDGRHLDAVKYWMSNAAGFDFLVVDGPIGSEPSFSGAQFPGGTFPTQVAKFTDCLKWLRNNLATGGKLLLWAETSIDMGQLDAQLPADWITLLTNAEAQVSGQAWFFFWGDHSVAANVRPLPVNTNGTSNATTTAVDLWENTQSASAVVPAQTVRAVAAQPLAVRSSSITATPQTVQAAAVMGAQTKADLFALFQSRYPASGPEIWVDGVTGNDANPGTSVAPKRTIQAAIDACSAGSRIKVRPLPAGQKYDRHEFRKQGNDANWIQMIGVSVGGQMPVIDGSFWGEGATAIQDGSHHIAIYGFEYWGRNLQQGAYETGISVNNGSHTVAVWGCYIHDMGSHAFAAPGDSGKGWAGCDKYDFCYNRVTRCARWNPFMASGFSFINCTDRGTDWADGYRNHIIGNVFDNCFIDDSFRAGSFWGITDGNAVILDVSDGYNAKTLMINNVAVGCGGRGLHVLRVNGGTDGWFNTCHDNCWNVDGDWKGEMSIQEAANCRMQYNVLAARPGSDRVGLKVGPNAVFDNNVYLRGDGGNDVVSPRVDQGNINKLATGPAGYFTSYVQGVFQQTVLPTALQAVDGLRPRSAEAVTVNPPTAIRNVCAYWPDAAGNYRPSGTWYMGAIDVANAGGGATVLTNVSTYGAVVGCLTVAARAAVNPPLVTGAASATTIVRPVSVDGLATVPIPVVQTVGSGPQVTVTPAPVRGVSGVPAVAVSTPGFAVVVPVTVAARVAVLAVSPSGTTPGLHALVAPEVVRVVASNFEVEVKGRRGGKPRYPKRRSWWQRWAWGSEWTP